MKRAQLALGVLAVGCAVALLLVSALRDPDSGGRATEDVQGATGVKANPRQPSHRVTTCTAPRMIDFIFRQCVRLLEWAARKLGSTYNAINVWIFCIIWPAVTIGLIIAVIVLWRKVAVLQHP